MLLKKMVDKGSLSEGRFSEIENKMMAVKGLSRAERKKNTSSRRKKAISPEHLSEIEKYVTNKSPTWGQALVIWLYASIATGLRPNEWLTAEIKEQDGQMILRSENFKYNDVRSYDTHREINLSGLPDIYKERVREQIAVVNGVQQEGMYDRYYKGCSNLLLHINKKLWPRRKANIQLYTGRHQFSANAKASLSTSDEERAAMMGHSTTQTSRERYGRKRSGGGGMTPEIADKEVLKKIISTEVKKRPSVPLANGPRSPEKSNG
jgi:integrase